MPTRLLAAAAVAITLAAGAGTLAQATAPAPETLKEALAISQRLGPVPASAPIHVALAFRSRHQGKPDPALVGAALASARKAGLQTSWVRGDGIAFLNGSARSVESFFGVRLTRYRTPNGREFFAGNREAALRPALRKIVDGVAGLDDFAQVSVAASRPGGLTPSDALSFYDIAALRAKGLDGTGETVVLPELNSPGDVPKLRQDLAYYAAKYHLPPFDLTVRVTAAAVVAMHPERPYFGRRI